MTPEFPEADMFTRATGEDWNAQVAEWEKRNAELAKVEAAQRAERKIAADALSRRANLAVLVTEFHRVGIDPPFTDGNGLPTVSLPMLLRLGWSIERVGDSNVLVQPAASDPVPRKTRADYDQST